MLRPCMAGKRDEGRQLLAPIYGWFTEGFDTPDLHEAKALLEALRRTRQWAHAAPSLSAHHKIRQPESDFRKHE
jgi:hypothetical protein